MICCNLAALCATVCGLRPTFSKYHQPRRELSNGGVQWYQDLRPMTLGLDCNMLRLRCGKVRDDMHDAGSSGADNSERDVTNQRKALGNTIDRYDKIFQRVGAFWSLR